MTVTVGKYPDLHTTDLVGANSAMWRRWGLGPRVQVGDRRPLVEDAVAAQVAALEARGGRVELQPGGYVYVDWR